MKQNKETDKTFEWKAEKFDDINILRFRIANFEQIDAKKKLLIYHLGEAALAGRDIIYDQNFKYNLFIRNVFEQILSDYKGDKKDKEFLAFFNYLKKIWFANGIHHHYSTDKFVPEFSERYFRKLISESGIRMTEKTKEYLIKILFDKDLYSKRVSQDSSKDLVLESANNFYEGVSQKEAEDFYQDKKSNDGDEPVSHGLHSKLSKKNGKIREERYSTQALYREAITKICQHLEKAIDYAENDIQKKSIELLILFYKTADLKAFDQYNINWLGDHESAVDFVNGFIEVYGDPLGMKGSWESMVNIRDDKASKRTRILSEHAQWFENNSPIADAYRKEKVLGVSAKVIDAIMLGGDCYPASPLGINLPNADWIRKKHGSKSVSIENIAYAYNQASKGNGFLEEFCFDDEELERAHTLGFQAGNLHTDLHECLGHGSGQLARGTSPDALKNYASPLEEARADLFALYYMLDPKLVELGLSPGEELAYCAYDSYLRNGLLTQMIRIKPGNQIEQAHMRCRQLISSWVLEQGKLDQSLEMMKKDEKSYLKINDYQKLRLHFASLLHEIQRIKSEGDYEAGKELVEKYGVKIQNELHREVLERYKKLNLAPYSGFINPFLIPVIEKGSIKDIKIKYDESYVDQMLRYSKEYAFLPVRIPGTKQ